MASSSTSPFSPPDRSPLVRWPTPHRAAPIFTRGIHMTRDGLTIAADLAEAALTLKRAAAIEDPSMRSEATWEAIERLATCTGPVASFADRVACRLEDGCDGTRLPPASQELQRQARLLEGHVETLIGIPLSRGLGRAAEEPASAGVRPGAGLAGRPRAPGRFAPSPSLRSGGAGLPASRRPRRQARRSASRAGRCAP
jgi:hypothetical protein